MKIWIPLIIVLASLLIVIPCSSQAKIISISAGPGHVLALNDDGTVWAWGRNGFGETGTGTTGFSVKVPQKVLIDNAQAVASGAGFSLTLKNDGTVWAWGNGVDGQLGYGGTTSQSTPVQVKDMTGIVSIAAGISTGYALKSDGTVWAWGLNDYGQVGDGTTENRPTPVQINGLSGIKFLGENGLYAVKDNGIVYAWGNSAPEAKTVPYIIEAVHGVVNITSGSEVTVYVRDDGTVWAWGSNRYGALGDGTITNTEPYEIKTSPVQVKIADVQAVSSTGRHSIALKKDGTVWIWGDYVDGRMLSDNYGSPSPVQVSGLDDVVDVGTGSLYYLVLKNDGSVWGWGQNGENVLGDKSMIATQPILVFKGPETAVTTPTYAAQPSGNSPPDGTLTPSGSTTPTTQPGSSSVPSPGFGINTVAVICGVFLLVGLLRALKCR